MVTCGGIATVVQAASIAKARTAIALRQNWSTQQEYRRGRSSASSRRYAPNGKRKALCAESG
jgi:hypothetical protein